MKTFTPEQFVAAKVHRHDEIGELSFSFNQMGEHLQSSFEKIRKEVTVRKRAEEALRTLNEELELRVEARTSELSRANKEISVLNEQLKDENIQMRAEMDLARRIQTSLLPPLVKDIHLRILK